MQKTTTVLAAVAIGATAIGISVASPAAATSSNCQQAGTATVCGQGDIRVGGSLPATAPNDLASVPSGSGCTTPYGTYQNCAVQAGLGRW